MEQQAILGSLAGAHDALLKGELSVSAGGGFSAPRPEARGGGLLPAVSATPPSPQSGRATGLTLDEHKPGMLVFETLFALAQARDPEMLIDYNISKHSFKKDVHTLYSPTWGIFQQKHS